MGWGLVVGEDDSVLPGLGTITQRGRTESSAPTDKRREMKSIVVPALLQIVNPALQTTIKAAPDYTHVQVLLLFHFAIRYRIIKQNIYEFVS